jgi:hypothetical protein
MIDAFAASHGHRSLFWVIASIRRSVAIALLAVCSVSVRAQELPLPVDPPPQFNSRQLNAPQFDVRQDGVLAESYGYHRQATQPQSIMPPEGAYRYGFPVETYRWGWFGAEHYYPYVVWHRGYNRDCVRWGYRRGY